MEEEILRFVETIPPHYVSLVLFVSSIVEAVFPPYPGDTVIVFCSFAAATQRHGLVYVLFLSISGSYIGALLLWAIGHRLSRVEQYGFLGWIFRSKSMERAQAVLHERGTIIVVLSRFIPGVRSFIIIAAGLSGMSFGTAAWAIALAVFMWQTILVSGGYTVGLYWLDIVSVISKAGAIIAILTMIILIIGWRVARKRQPR